MQAPDFSTTRPCEVLSVVQTADRSDIAPPTNQGWSRADALIENVEKLLWETAEDAGELLAAVHHQITSAGKRFRARLTLALAGQALAKIGMAYQMLDDLNAARGHKEGRAAGSDLARGRLTAPTIAHLRSLDRLPADLPTLTAVRRNRHAIETVEASIHAHLQTAVDLALGLPTPAAEVITSGLAILFPAYTGSGPGHHELPVLRCVS